MSIHPSSRIPPPPLLAFASVFLSLIVPDLHSLVFRYPTSLGVSVRSRIAQRISISKGVCGHNKQIANMQSTVRQLLLFISCLLLLLSVVQAAPVRPSPLVTPSANSLTNCLDQRCAIVYISIYTLKRFQVASPEALEKRVAEPIADALARRIPVRPVQSTSTPPVATTTTSPLVSIPFNTSSSQIIIHSPLPACVDLKEL